MGMSVTNSSNNHHESHSGRIKKANYPAYLYGSELIFRAWGTFLINLELVARCFFQGMWSNGASIEYYRKHFYVASNLHVAWLDSNYTCCVISETRPDLGRLYPGPAIPKGLAST